MPSKAPGERYRYIAFSIEGEPTFARNDFLDSLIHVARGTPLANSFRITVFEDNFGILKVPHLLKEEAIATLSKMDSIRGAECKVSTLRTSGTIKTLKVKYKSRIGKNHERS
jgi:RNase P/RNase MRP subunit POP5